MKRLAFALAAGLLSVWAAGAAVAQPAAQGDEQAARAALKRTTELLGRAARFSVTIDIGFDVVPDSGQKIEFGETRRVVVRRPDRLRVDDVRRNGDTSGLRYDGQALTVFNLKDKVYATVGTSGTVDDLIAFVINELEMRFPLAEMLDTRIAAFVGGKVREAAYVEQATIAGVPCDHVAFRGEREDLQLWIARTGSPLPQRLVITYLREDGRPQFWAQFRDWNLAPEASDSAFTFTPPGDHAKIPLVPRSAKGGRP